MNLHTLEESLARISDAILIHGGQISDIQGQLTQKTNDRALGIIFERVAS